MRKLVFIIGLLTINIFFLHSQLDQEILSKALQSYKKEQPKLEKQAFRELRKLDKSYRKPKNSEFGKYCFLIISTFKLKDKYVHYHIRGTDTFVKYIDFGKMHNKFDTFVFKDSIYQGYLSLYHNASFYFSLNDTNRYNKPAFIGQYHLAKQIMDFKPDMVLYPDCPLFLCFIKEGKLYIGRVEKQLQTVDYILPAEDFIKKNPSFIKELHDNKNPDLKHYIELH